MSAECLATQLEALKEVVEQTKQAAQVLHEEQQEITEQARCGQAKLLQVEADLALSNKEKKELVAKVEEWETKAKELHQESTTLKRQLADETEKSRKLTKTLEERDVLEEARKKRSEQVEKELQEAQALLLSASTAAADSDALSSLNETVMKLQEANKKLYEQLEEHQESARADKDRLRESLLLAEQEAQHLRVEACLQSDKDIGRQNANSSPMTNTPSSAASNLDTSFAIKTTVDAMSTPQSSVGGDHEVPQSTKCSICFKDIVGDTNMKPCQCGMPDCDKRAHLSCVNQIHPGPSVSHPGTPAAKLPVVLCSGAMKLAGITKNNQGKEN